MSVHRIFISLNVSSSNDPFPEWPVSSKNCKKCPHWQDWFCISRKRAIHGSGLFEKTEYSGKWIIRGSGIFGKVAFGENSTTIAVTWKYSIWRIGGAPLIDGFAKGLLGWILGQLCRYAKERWTGWPSDPGADVEKSIFPLIGPHFEPNVCIHLCVPDCDCVNILLHWSWSLRTVWGNQFSTCMSLKYHDLLKLLRRCCTTGCCSGCVFFFGEERTS